MRLDVIEKIINIPISIGLEEFIIHFYGWALQIRSFFRILFLWIFSLLFDDDIWHTQFRLVAI